MSMQFRRAEKTRGSGVNLGGGVCLPGEIRTRIECARERPRPAGVEERKGPGGEAVARRLPAPVPPAGGCANRQFVRQGRGGKAGAGPEDGLTEDRTVGTRTRVWGADLPAYAQYPARPTRGILPPDKPDTGGGCRVSRVCRAPPAQTQGYRHPLRGLECRGGRATPRQRTTKNRALPDRHAPPRGRRH